MRLLLGRHATAVDATRPADDDFRWLTPGGRAEARALGVRLAEWGEIPEAILTSPLVRAVQTADALADGAGFTSEIASTAALGPDGALSELLDLLAEVGTGRVATVGHEPQVSAWAARLLGLPRLPLGFERCMVVAIDFDGPPALDRGTLAYVTTPRRPERFRF